MEATKEGGAEVELRTCGGCRDQLAEAEFIPRKTVKGDPLPVYDAALCGICNEVYHWAKVDAWRSAEDTEEYRETTVNHAAQAACMREGTSDTEHPNFFEFMRGVYTHVYLKALFLESDMRRSAELQQQSLLSLSTRQGLPLWWPLDWYPDAKLD